MPQFRSLFVALAVLVGITALATPARAQFSPRGSGVVGEDYHVEVSYNFWGPTPDIIINSEALGIPGSDVDLVQDLGIEKQTLKDLRIVLRPAKKHRFRISYLPMDYSAETVLEREFVFNGLRYRPGLPVSTTAQFKTWRFGYEYDFLYRERGFLGVIFDAKYTDANVGLNSPLGDEFSKAIGALPTIGLVARVYAASNLALNGEITYFKLPDSAIEDTQGRYKDFDVSATYNPHKNVGVQLGLRSIDLSYQVKLDAGTLVMRSVYFGGTLRF
ncbi:MAG: hypothetical protein AB7O28_19840 [Vicinamibacterales bacterium]